MPTPKTLLRRTITISAVYLALIAIFALLVPALLLAATADALTNARWSRCRFVLAIAVLVGFQAFGILASFATFLAYACVWCSDRSLLFKRWNQKLVIFWGDRLFAVLRWIMNMSLEVRGEACVEKSPMIIFVRHNSVADVFLCNTLIGQKHQIFLRYAIKSELLWDPCQDLVLPRVGGVFLHRNSSDSASQIAKVKRLCDNLGEHEGVVIYPEGTRFTPQKRDRILSKFLNSNRTKEWQEASSLRSVLPLQLGGPLALLANNPGADLVFCAHVGLDALTKIADFWSGRAIGKTIKVLFWRIPYREIPETKEQQIAFLKAQWQRMDQELQTL